LNVFGWVIYLFLSSTYFSFITTAPKNFFEHILGAAAFSAVSITPARTIKAAQLKSEVIDNWQCAQIMKLEICKVLCYTVASL
jgi:hypothetical protein